MSILSHQLGNALNAMFQRELRSFKRELEAYPDEASVWVTAPGISNSAGTLTLHCAGNLQHFIGARLGNSGYARDRDAEFRRRDVPRTELYREIDRAIQSIEATLGDSASAEFPDVYPEQLAGKSVSTETFLLHLAAHLGYHLGQVDYHRRLTTGSAVTVDGVPVRELPAFSTVQ
jgi:hypothetical protein